jgi:N-acetylneuraminic acid mutarotase
MEESMHQIALRAGVASAAALTVIAGLYPAIGQQAAAATSRRSAASVPAAAAAAKPGRGAAPRQHPVRRVCGGPARPGRAACMALERTDIKPHRGLYARGNAAAGPSGYGPTDLQSAYSLPSPSAGTGQTVAVIDAYDDPNAEADLAVYRAQYGLPACTSATGCFQKVAQDGSTNYPSPDPEWGQEISLDLDMVSAICPNCHILLVEADDNTISNLGTAVNEAVALGAQYISNSYAGAEQPWQTTYDSSYFNHPGVVVTASSGDTGYGAQYPASSPYVTAVGGTTLVQDPRVARGWSETAWAGAGSGCSAYESKPPWQTDKGCSARTVADVSADADPNTGVAVYDSYDQGGWGVYGGTSVAAPLIASVYALAGPPATGSYPASYPYAAAAALNDVTSGSNGDCTHAYICTAGPGYDGPTGLGTPDGVSAFQAGPHGTIAGTLTDAATGKPLTNAEVDIGTVGKAFTNAAGRYASSVPPGSYQVTAKAFGYTTKTMSGVQVTGGTTTTESVALQALPSVTVSGTVTDGSGQGWPLYASISVPGTPALTYTSPATGHYSLTLPDNASYQLQIDPVYPGYQQVTQHVQVATSNLTQNVSVPVDATTCSAPGYQWQYNGSTQTFDASSVPAGWTVTNASGTGNGWEFDDPGGLPNNTGGSGNFAVAAAEFNGREDTQLIIPVIDMSGDSTPVVQFNTDLVTASFGDTASVDVSIDGGQTWSTVWQYQNSPGLPGPDLETVPLPSAAGQPDVQVRFHYQSLFGFFWEVDNVFLGNRSCTPVPGGLVAGNVIDGNTGAGVNGATVAEAGQATQVTTTPTPDDPGLPDGFYSMFSPAGSQQLTASMLNYTSGSGQVNVTAHATTIGNITLQAGQLSVTPASVSAAEPPGGSASRPLRFTDTGRAPVSVRLDQQPGGFTVAGTRRPARTATPPGGAPLRRVHGHFSPLFLGHRRAGTALRQAGRPAGTTRHPAAATLPAAGPAGTAWTSITPYPIPVMDNGVATDPGTGQVYSVGGLSNGLSGTSAGFVYDPATQQWSALPAMPQAVEAPQAAFIDGKLYVVGGWDANGNPVQKLQIYDPRSHTWSGGAYIPHGYAAAGVAVLNGEIYIVGGCGNGYCGYRDVQVYDPATNAWSTVAPYPQPVSWEGCGAIDGSVYCAGGVTSSATGADTNAGYSYNPASGQWSPIAGVPIDLWGMSYATANGQLLLSGGVTNGETTVTNQGFAYNPSSGTWSDLPNSVNTDYRAGGGCGFYRIGGTPSGTNYENIAEQLPGYSTCTGTSVPWLSESQDAFTLSPGQSVTVMVTMKAAAAAAAQPGSYTANLIVNQDTPYQVTPVGVTMTVTPPPGSGKLTGTVTGLSCHGSPAPLAGATVEVYGAQGASWMAQTASDGSYSLWLPSRARLTVIAALDGWQPQVKYSSPKPLQPATVSFALRADGQCGGT